MGYQRVMVSSASVKFMSTTSNLVDRELYGFSEVMSVMGYHKYDGRKNLLMNLLRFKLVHLTGQCTSHDISHVLDFTTTLITLSKP